MKNLLVLMLIFWNGITDAPLFAQPVPVKGYELTVSINAYKGQFLYLGYHYGKIKALADSALVKPNGKAVFSGPTRLPGGIYFMVSPKKEILYEVLIDKVQQFSMTVDSGKTDAVKFIGTTENVDFQNYTKFVGAKGQAINDQQALLAKTTTRVDSVKIQENLKRLNTEILQYRSDLVKKSPGTFLAALFAALQEPEIPPAAKHPNGRYDSAYAFNFYKSHYWDGLSFTDARLLRTPFFEARLLRYYRDLVSPEPDSIKKEIDVMLLAAKPDKEVYKFLLTHFVQQYINPQYMGQDAVFVHLFEKYINEKPEVDWFTDKYKKYMTDRAYSLMANLIGNPAWDLAMTDTTGKISPLYEVGAPFTVVCFWDPTCGHCKEMVPHLDSMFQHKWKQQGIKIYGVMTDGGKDNWLKYIRENNLNGWIHVYQTEEQKEVERNSGKPGFRQLYDVYQTPVLYLLDEQKRIIGKKLNYQQMDELITVKKQKTAANR